MKHCLVKVVLMLIITSYKGMVDAVVPDYMCTYPVSHDRETPQWEFFHIDDDFLRDDNAIKETCWDYCNKAEKCRSAQLIIHGDRRRYCYRYNITVQELKDTRRYLEIFIQTDADEYPTYITYDRDCAECTYPVSYVSKAPKWHIHRIGTKHDNITTFKTCQGWCNEDVNCRSVTNKIWGDERFCYKYSISVQELNDSGRYNEIVKEYAYSIITYDKQCADPPSIMCSNTYPVSHDREYPDMDIYFIGTKHDNIRTFKACQGWCNEDVNCRSVMYTTTGAYGRSCSKFSISLQELKDSGRYNEIKKLPMYSYITYDKQCVEVSPTTEGPGTDVDEVNPATKGPGTNVAAIGEPIIVLIVMIGAGAVFVAPRLPGAVMAF